MRFCVFLIGLTIVSNIHGSNGQWHWLHPYPTGNGITGISFTDENTGWFGSVLLTEGG